MRRDETKRCDNAGDASRNNLRTSMQCRQFPKRKLLTHSRHGAAHNESDKAPQGVSNQIFPMCDECNKTSLKNKLVHQYELEEVMYKLNSEASSSLRSKALILVTIFLVQHLGCAVGVRTAWVRQSLSSFNVEDEFHRFVEATGGNREKFRFDGNFFSSPEKSEVWDQPPDSSSFGKSFRPETQNKNIPIEPEVTVPAIQRDDEEIRVPRSFYIDIFDSSLPVDSPHQKSLRASRQPRPPQQSLPFGPKMQFTVTKNPYHFSSTQEPFSGKFLSTSLPQKVHRLKNFTFQRLGRKKFPNGQASDQKTTDSITTQNPSKKLNDRGSMRFESKPRGTNNALVTTHNGSSGFSQYKPSVPIFTSTFYQRPGGKEPALGTLSLGFPPSPRKKEGVESGISGAAVGRSSENGAKSGRPSGCVDEKGIFRHQRERWFGQDCTRHTCVVFRSRHFIETDSCESEIRNTSYRCFVVANKRANYPHCCPQHTCHPDNLGRPSDR